MAVTKEIAEREEKILTSVEIIDQMAAEPTLDRFFDADPRTLTDADLREFVEIQRRKRSLFIQKEADK